MVSPWRKCASVKDAATRSRSIAANPPNGSIPVRNCSGSATLSLLNAVAAATCSATLSPAAPVDGSRRSCRRRENYHVYRLCASGDGRIVRPVGHAPNAYRNGPEEVPPARRSAFSAEALSLFYSAAAPFGSPSTARRSTSVKPSAAALSGANSETTMPMINAPVIVYRHGFFSGKYHHLAMISAL
jgi:hypothetical protein